MTAPAGMLAGEKQQGPSMRDRALGLGLGVGLDEQKVLGR